MELWDGSSRARGVCGDLVIVLFKFKVNANGRLACGERWQVVCMCECGVCLGVRCLRECVFVSLTPSVWVF